MINHKFFSPQLVKINLHCLTSEELPKNNIEYERKAFEGRLNSGLMMIGIAPKLSSALKVCDLHLKYVPHPWEDHVAE